MISRRGAVAALLLGPLLAPGAASAATRFGVEVGPGAEWPRQEVVLSLPDKRVLTSDQLELTENGDAVLGARLTSEADNRKRGVVLVIDTSLTMRGRPIREALSAARSFAQRRPASTPLGVVFFAGVPRVALPPTTDARKIKATLAVGPAISRGTTIYDAAGAGLTALRRAGLTSGAVIVLSDGAEAIKGSATTPAQLAAAARRGKVRIFSVGLESRSFDAAALRTMADGTGGRYGQAARPEDLPPLFAAIGERLSSEFLVTYKSTARAGSRVRLEAGLNGFPGTEAIEYTAPKIALARVAPGRAVAAAGLDELRVGLLAGGAFAVITLVLYLLLRPKQRTVISRVADFAGSGLPGPTMQDVRERKPGRERTPSRRWQRYAEAVELAGIGVSPSALALWTMILTTVFSWYLVTVADRPQLLVFAFAIPVVVRVAVLSRLKARRIAFEDQLPDNLQVLASALRAGYSFTAALSAMANDAPEPSRTELRRASDDEKLGADVSESLRNVATRMDNQEIEYVGIVAKMQRESGGNTAEVLDKVIETVRERLRLRRMVRTLTAQSRMGGAVISAMPLVLGVGMSITNPGYFDPMFKSPVGVTLFIVGFLMLGAGWLTIRKIVEVEN